MKKWFISFIIAILPLAASAEIVQVDGLWYNLDDTAPVATVVSWQNESYSGDIVIPATINYGGTAYTVTGIGENAFNGCENVTSVVISEGIQTIETSAFMSCHGLKSVVLPASLTTIGFWSFGFCENLNYVIYKAENPVEIDRTAFCASNSVLNGVETYNYSSAILYVPNGALANYQNTIGWDVFPTIFQGERNEAKVGDLKYAYASGSLEAAVIRDDYSSLESVNIPSTVTIDGAVYAVKAIGNAAFRENQQITSVTFNEGLVLICKDAFSICSQAVFNLLPSTIKFIGNNSFCSCNRIEEIIIPEGCAVIESMAFAWCGNIEWIELPSTLTSLGQTAFAGSSNLKTVISRISRPFAIHDDVFCKEEQWNEVGEATIVNTDATLYVPTDTKTSYQETDGWKLFAEVVEGEVKRSKEGDLNYEYVVGGGTATVITGDYTNLESVTIPGTITIDGNSYTVVAIADEVFAYCNNLTSVTLNEGLETIGNRAFQGCWDSEFNALPSSVKSIGDESFFNCNKIAKLIIPEGCITIGDRAFESCHGLQRVEFPSSLTSIGGYAFINCYSIETVISRISHPFNIEKSVFSNLHSDKNDSIYFEPSKATLYVPVNTKSSYQAIEGWTMFADILEGEPKETVVDGLSYIYLEGSQTAIVVKGDYSEMKFVTIPSSIVVDGDSYAVTAIGQNAFEWCGNIQKFEIPSSITSIGKRAFLGITSMVVSHIQSPFSISESTFAGSERWDETAETSVYSKSEATLYVPMNTKSSYMAAEGWDMFANIIEGEPKEAKVGDLYYSYLVGGATATVIAGDYSSLEEVIIPSMVEIDGTSYRVNTIGNAAFYNCGNIKSVVFEQGLETIGNEAFRWCNQTVFGDLPYSITTIGDRAFDNCSGITNLTIPENCKSIGIEAFLWCREILRIELPSSLTSIGDYAFRGCEKLSTVISRIEDPFVIEENVFRRETWMQDTQEYEYSPSHANLYVPEGTLSKYKAIKGWTMFAGMYEGDLLETTIGALKYIYFPSDHTAMVIAGNYASLKEVEIPGTVEIEGSNYQVREIGAGAFKDCSQIQKITIGYGVEVVGYEAFRSCADADFGTLPSSIRKIDDFGFWNCNLFKELEIPEGVETIGASAFASCVGLQKVILPNSVTSVGERAFENNSRLSIVVSHISEPFYIHNDVFGKTQYDESTQQNYYTPCGARLYVPEGTLVKYKALEGWTMFVGMFEGEIVEARVGDLTYSYNSSSKMATVVRGENYSELNKKITIPTSVEIEGETYQVKDIAAQAFYNTPITSLVFEGGLESIDIEAFANCNQLNAVSLPSSLTTLGDAAFRDCSRLGSVFIPVDVNKIGQSVFAGCKSMKSIEVAEGNRTFESRGSNAVIEIESNTLVVGCLTTVIPASVTAIGKEAFCNLDIETIDIPATVTMIDDNAFNSCHELSEITLPEGLLTLGNTAFHSCSGLTYVELPNSLKNIGDWIFTNCSSLKNVVSNIENPTRIGENTFGPDDYLYSQATLWVPRGMIDTYMELEGWNRFENYDELLHDNLTKPTVSYNGRYLTMSNDVSQRAEIYYSMDGSKPSILYRDTIVISNLGTIQAISKRFGSYTVDTTVYKIEYVYDGVIARTASGGMLKNAFEWCGTDKIETLDIEGTLNDDDFGTIRSMSKLNTLNMAASKLSNGIIPAEAFASTKLQWYVSPYTMTGVGANIFKGCDQLAAITWNSSSTELPEDVATDVANPNLLVYAKSLAMIPYSLKNVVINGIANNIVLADSTGNNNFYVPEEFTACRISYTHDYKQKTVVGKTQGWETIALPFTVSSITHETNGELTPLAVKDAEKPFWLYELGDNGLEAATKIEANIPYLICMPNDDAYGDEYMQGGLVTFSAKNVTITTSTGTAVSQGDRQFVPTYKRVAASSDIYVLNVNEAVGDNPMGSAFIQNLREVRPFEAYSVHGTNRSRIISVSSLGGGDATGINDPMLKNGVESDDAVVKVYSLSGTLIKHGKREEVLRSLPKGLYIINGKKIIK